MYKFNKTVVAILSTMTIITICGIVFYSCNKENATEEIVVSKIGKNGETIMPLEDWIEGHGNFCNSIGNLLGIHPHDFAISYLDSDGIIKFYFISQTSELGRILMRDFLQKVETFKGSHEDYCKWSEVQKDKGNIVVVRKGDDGLYHGRSYTDSEWSLKLQGIID